MKTTKLYNRLVDKYVDVNVHKSYDKYGIIITDGFTGGYYLIDIKSGLFIRHFRKLKDAKSFMEHTEEENFKNMIKLVEKARNCRIYAQYVFGYTRRIKPL